MMSMTQSVFPDTTWSVREPLIEEGCPKSKPYTEEPSTDDIRNFLAPSERHEVARPVICDRGYASRKFHENFWNRGSHPIIPPGKNDPEVTCPIWAYRPGHVVKNLWAGFKEWRAVATRYEKNSCPFPLRYPHRCYSRLYQGLCA